MSTDTSSEAHKPAPGAPEPVKWFSPDMVLRGEANAIHAGRPMPDVPTTGVSEDSTTWSRIEPEVTGPLLYKALHERNSQALCLSGGGIRSASFNVGVIEALAVHPRPGSDSDAAKQGDAQAGDPAKSLLAQFHYLSTVSGGGYIGSWLSAWIARDGYAKVWPKLIGRREHPEKEPSELAWLRSYSNFLTPRLGLFSADTWAGVALVARNLILNWLIIIPALCLALFAVKLVAVLAFWLSQARGPALVALAGSAAALLLCALTFVLINRPSRNPGQARPRWDVWNAIRTVFRKPAAAGGGAWQVAPGASGALRYASDAQQDETKRVGAGADELRFKLWCLAPALLSAFLFSLYLTVRYAALGKFTLAATAALAAATGAGVYLLSWLLASIWIACRKPADRPRLELGQQWRDLVAWFVAGTVYGALIGVGIHMLATTLGSAQIQALGGHLCVEYRLCLSTATLTMLALLIAGVPWIITAQLTAEMIFVGLTNWQRGSDADREWFGRSTGWFTIAATAWFLVAFLVIIGPALVWMLFVKFTWAKYGTAILAAVSAAATTLLGKSSKTGAVDQPPGKTAWWIRLVMPVSTIVFLILLVLGVSATMDDLLFGQMLVESPLLGSGAAADLASQRRWLIGGIALVFLVAAVASAHVNINRFSIHSLYRNRLIRAYLGASNAARAPNPFTGFDECDNKPMHSLWPEPRDAAPNDGQWRPFHVINIALNVVNANRLAWQERKAESFTVSPMHCGTAANDLGYRRTCEYGGEGGISLGTALAISGAAASPNMGYHSSPLVTLLLALFNVRLGWWLGNPGTPAGNATYQLDGPALAIKPFLAEMFGQTTDTWRYVYLSDGGHFENLGLYEMIRRRCRCIVISDAGQDANYDFADLGNAARKIAIDLGIYITFSELREIKRRSKDNSVIKGAYYAVGEIDYRTAPERTPALGEAGPSPQDLGQARKAVENGYILYIKPSYHGNESVGIVSYAAANAAFPHESTADLFFGESQFESYRTLGFEIVDAVLKQAKAKAEEIGKAAKAGEWKPDNGKICDLIRSLAPQRRPDKGPRLSDALRRLDPDDLQEVQRIIAPAGKS